MDQNGQRKVGEALSRGGMVHHGVLADMPMPGENLRFVDLMVDTDKSSVARALNALAIADLIEGVRGEVVHLPEPGLPRFTIIGMSPRTNSPSLLTVHLEDMNVRDSLTAEVAAIEANLEQRFARNPTTE